MNAVILCAGFATRMYPLTKDFPKPLLKVVGRPVLDYLIDQVVTLPDIQSIHIVSNAKFFDHFVRWYDERQAGKIFKGISVHIHNDGCADNKNRLGAAGDLQLALKKIGLPGRVLVSGGDNIYQFPIKPLCETFLQNKHHFVIALVETELTKLQKTGVLEFGENDRVVRLHEKPARPLTTWICPPLYFFQPSLWTKLHSFLETPGNHDAPGYFIDYLCQQESVHAFKLNAKRLDIGSVESYHEADRQLRQKTTTGKKF